MANEEKKDFNARMNNSKNMPKIVELGEEETKKWGGKKMIIAPPIYYDQIMKKIPQGKIITTAEIRTLIAKENKCDITCPLTAGIFINICAWASYQRSDNITPYWRTLKTGGFLNPKYPGGILYQKQKSEEEGHKIVQRGKDKYLVENYETKIFALI